MHLQVGHNVQGVCIVHPVVSLGQVSLLHESISLSCHLGFAWCAAAQERKKMEQDSMSSFLVFGLHSSDDGCMAAG